MQKLVLLLCFFMFSSISFASNKAILLHLSGAIGPATQDYVKRGIDLAEKENASVIILEIDTPGGLASSTRGINAAIIASNVPVVAYVAPAGARAASAGTYILYASHLAAMAPGTNLGAASPVAISTPGEKSKSEKPSSMDKKMMNDSVAYIKSLAELRDRNIDWAEKAVRQADSISAEEAKRLNVINDIASNHDQLLKQIDGKKVKLPNKTQIIETSKAEIKKIEPGWRYQVLAFITDPTITYILMMIAIYGLFFELSNPGLILPGVAGVISILLVLYAFQVMPVNFVGLALLLLGVAFMIAEVYVSSFGALGIGGIIAFILGSIMMFDTGHPDFQIAIPLIVGMSAISIAFFICVVSLAVGSHKRAIITGREGLIGQKGMVISVMNNQVMVRVQGEMWEAHSTENLDQGQKIRVVGVNGLLLRVVRIGD